MEGYSGLNATIACARGSRKAFSFLNEHYSQLSMVFNDLRGEEGGCGKRVAPTLSFSPLDNFSFSNLTSFPYFPSASLYCFLLH